MTHHNLQSFAGTSSGQAVGLRSEYRARDLWVTEYTITYDGRPFYTVSMTEFRAGKVVHETQYFAEPFPSGMAWRFGLSDALMPNRSQSKVAQRLAGQPFKERLRRPALGAA
jgi:hypothetical protein